MSNSTPAVPEWKLDDLYESPDSPILAGDLSNL